MRTPFLLFLFILTSLAAQTLERKELTVDGILREGLIHIPAAASNTPCPVVFVFHGHGGHMSHAANGFGVHRLWPEAIVVYLQGLPTPGKLTDPEGKKSGWQSGPGDMQDRDLKLVDAVLAALESRWRIDRKRIFSTGHSNGGGFSYLLWAMRGDVFAAVAPMAALLADEKTRALMKPKPVFHVAGEKDPLVKFAWQKMMMEFVRKLNGCSETAIPATGGPIVRYDSTNGAPLVAYIHPGGHEMLAAALPHIVSFFKEMGGR